MFPLEPGTHLQQCKFHLVLPSVLLKEKWNKILKSVGGICYISDQKNITTCAGPQRCLSLFMFSKEFLRVLLYPSQVYFLNNRQSTLSFLLGLALVWILSLKPIILRVRQYHTVEQQGQENFSTGISTPSKHLAIEVFGTAYHKSPHPY